MEIARLGTHELTVCRFCDKLFDIAGLESPDAIEELQTMLAEHIARSPTCKAAKEELSIDIQRAEAEIAIATEQAYQRYDRELDEHPDNGKFGYWHVEGIRHDARCKASSAREAIEKCSEVVGDWESPDATFIGEELPDVF